MVGSPTSAMIDLKPFVDKAETASERSVLAHGEARLSTERQLGDTGLLCAVEDGLVFVEEDVLNPGEVTIIDVGEVRVARIEQGFLDSTLLVDTGDEVLRFEGMKEELAAEILEGAGLPQRLTDAGANASSPSQEQGEDPFGIGSPDGAVDPATRAARGVMVADHSNHAVGRAFFGDTESSGARLETPPVPAAKSPSSVGRVVIGLAFAMLLLVGMWVARLESTTDAPGSSSQVTIQVVHDGAHVRQADIFLQGTKVCSSSPCTVSPRAGVYSIRAQAGGRVGQTIIDLEAGAAMEVTIGLAEPTTKPPSEHPAAHGTLRLSSSHADVHVFVDGVHKGTLPLVLPELEPGTVELRFERAGIDQVLVRTVEVLPGQVSSLHVELPGTSPTDAGTATVGAADGAAPAATQALEP